VCKWYNKKWEQPDATKASCKELGYNRVCEDWENTKATQVNEKTPNVLKFDVESLFEHILVDHGFELQLGLDKTLRKVKQECADNGFDVDINDKAFEALGNKLIGLRQVKFLIMGLGLIQYEETIMTELIKSMFGHKDKK
jgi:hypothetical protein